MVVKSIGGIEGGRFVERWPSIGWEKIKWVGEVLWCFKKLRHIQKLKLVAR